MAGNILIPGGEISLVDVGTWTDKNGNTRPSPAKVWVTFGTQKINLRIDQLKALFTSVMNEDRIRDFLGEKFYENV